MASSKIYQMPGLDLDHLATTLERWLRNQGRETQTLPNPAGVTVQAREARSWVQKGGGGVALAIQLVQRDAHLQVQVGSSRWGWQAASGVAAAIVFWPLLALPAYAAYKQKELIDDTWAFVDQYVATGGQVEVPDMGFDAGMAGPSAATVSAPSPNTVACPSCGKPVKATARFCAECGAKLQLECSECGATLRADAKFCDNCGAKVATE